MLAFRGTPVAPVPGRCETTIGTVMLRAGPVVNWLSKVASGFPKRSLTALVTTTLTLLDAGNPDGFRVTTRLSAEMLIVIACGVPLTKSPMLFVLIVLAFSDSENVSTTTARGPTP